MQTIIEKLSKIELILLANKKILNVTELMHYTGFSKSYIYKLCSSGILPFSRPTGKVLFFERKKIDSFLLSNPNVALNDIEQEAINYLSDKPWKRGSK